MITKCCITSLENICSIFLIVAELMEINFPHNIFFMHQEAKRNSFIYQMELTSTLELIGQYILAFLLSNMRKYSQENLID
jgi:hypothetical protein